MSPNPGRLPPAAIGKRIWGVLANGMPFGREQITSVSPTGWAADGQGACRWTRTGSPFDIKEWEIAK